MDAGWKSMSDDNVKPNTDEDNKKPLAGLLVVDGDPDIVHVLKHGLLSYGFLVDHLPIPKRYYKLSNPIRRAIVWCWLTVGCHQYLVRN